MDEPTVLEEIGSAGGTHSEASRTRPEEARPVREDQLRWK